MRCGGKPRPVALTRIGGSGRLLYPRSIRKQFGYGARSKGADRSFPARGPWFWPCIGPR
jgi:hypothetical protein